MCFVGVLRPIESSNARRPASCRVRPLASFRGYLDTVIRLVFRRLMPHNLSQAYRTRDLGVQTSIMYFRTPTEGSRWLGW
jgi:hypothetical protein